MTVPDQRKGFGPGRRARREVIGAVEIYVVHLVARHKRLDVERLVGLGHCLGDLLGLEGDVIAGAGLVALHLLFGLDALAGFGVDELAMDAVARLAIEYVEGDPLGRRGRGIERDRAGHLAGFENAFPVCARRHDPLPRRAEGCMFNPRRGTRVP